MRVFKNASIDRLMARKAERNLKSGLFDSYLTGFLTDRNYGSYNSLTGLNTLDALNTSGVQFNFYEAKRQILNDRIEKAVNSGEPLRGVSYNEYLMYYLEKNGSIDTDTQQFYKQALTGDNAALRNKQWRTDPNYIIPKRLYNAPLITADRDAALEKLAKNEQLEDWEQKLLDTVTNKTDTSGSDKK